jgi:hypothetical protein
MLPRRGNDKYMALGADGLGSPALILFLILILLVFGAGFGGVDPN